MKRKVKRTIDGFAGEVRRQINDLTRLEPYRSLDQELFSFSKKCLQNYVNWCSRHQLDPENREYFYLYYGIDSNHGTIRFKKHYNIANFEEMLDRAWELTSRPSTKLESKLEIQEKWTAVLKAKTSSTEFTKHRVDIIYHLKNDTIDWKFKANYRGITADGFLTLTPSNYNRHLQDLSLFLRELLMLLGFKSEEKTQITLQKYQYRRPPRPFKAWHRYHCEKRIRQLSKEWRKEDQTTKSDNKGNNV